MVFLEPLESKFSLGSSFKIVRCSGKSPSEEEEAKGRRITAMGMMQEEAKQLAK